MGNTACGLGIWYNIGYTCQGISWSCIQNNPDIVWSSYNLWAPRAMTDHVSRSREALRQGDISSASLHCQQALNDDGESYAALVWVPFAQSMASQILQALENRSISSILPVLLLSVIRMMTVCWVSGPSAISSKAQEGPKKECSRSQRGNLEDFLDDGMEPSLLRSSIVLPMTCSLQAKPEHYLHMNDMLSGWNRYGIFATQGCMDLATYLDCTGPFVS